MDTTTATLIGLGIFALVVIAFFTVFRGKGKFRIKTILGEATGEGENPSPPSAVASGVKISGAQAGRDIYAHSSGAGGVDAENAKAGGNIDATHSPGSPPPKT